jgi:hypothetical protein
VVGDGLQILYPTSQLRLPSRGRSARSPNHSTSTRSCLLPVCLTTTPPPPPLRGHAQTHPRRAELSNRRIRWLASTAETPARPRWSAQIEREVQATTTRRSSSSSRRTSDVAISDISPLDDDAAAAAAEGTRSNSSSAGRVVKPRLVHVFSRFVDPEAIADHSRPLPRHGAAVLASQPLGGLAISDISPLDDDAAAAAAEGTRSNSSSAGRKATSSSFETPARPRWSAQIEREVQATTTRRSSRRR